MNQASRPVPVTVTFACLVSIILSAEVPEIKSRREFQGLSQGEADVVKSSKSERSTTLMLNVKKVNGRYLT